MAEPALRLADKKDKVETVSNDWALVDSSSDSGGPFHPVETEESEAVWLVSYADMMTLLVGFFVVLQSFSKIDTQEFEKIKKETTKLFGGEYKIPYEDLTKDLKKVVDQMGLSNQVVFNQTDQGIEITFRGALFFDSGAYELREEANKLLDQLVPIITEKAKDFGIVVEGHTDSTPLVAKGPLASNWELSSVRACRVLRFFQDKGFSPLRLKSLGWGDTRPILPNTDANNNPLPENQAQNRRVVIKILKNFEVQ